MARASGPLQFECKSSSNRAVEITTLAWTDAQRNLHQNLTGQKLQWPHPIFLAQRALFGAVGKNTQRQVGAPSEHMKHHESKTKLKVPNIRSEWLHSGQPPWMTNIMSAGRKCHRCQSLAKLFSALNAICFQDVNFKDQFTVCRHDTWTDPISQGNPLWYIYIYMYNKS